MALIRKGPPLDDEDDYQRRVWAGSARAHGDRRGCAPRLDAAIGVPQCLSRLKIGR